MEEHHLQGASKAEIAEMVREYSDWRAPPLELDRAIDAINKVRKLPIAARAIVASYLASNELFCRECGQTSCIHGYSDE